MINPYELIEGIIYDTRNTPILNMVPVGCVIKILLKEDILMMVTPYIKDRQSREGIGINLKTGHIVYIDKIPKDFKYKLIRFATN